MNDFNYSDFIYLNKNFLPVYDIENEIQDYWKTFIPTDYFKKEILRGILNSLESNDLAQKKSFWLQGTYGTGKSHAASVIKHLLSDPFEEIEDYIDENFENDVQLKERLKNFRSQKRFLAVTIKGADAINNPVQLGIAIKIAVKKILNKYPKIKVKTDFDDKIEKLERGVIDWDSLKKGTKLESYSKEEIISQLKNEDIYVLNEIEEILLAKERIYIAGDNITDWLVEIAKELKNQNIADGLFIFWDEFTSILYHQHNHLLLQAIQNIAELSKNQDIYLFLITHRTLDTINFNLDNELIGKLKDRFDVFKYQMEPVTTFYLLSKMIKIKKAIIDDKSNNFEEFKRIYLSKIDDLIRFFVRERIFETKEQIEEIFPLHPYTAYLATFISRYLGSANRSIFSFLYDSEHGFDNFIKQNPARNNQVFLTADSLWDYFYNDFEEHQEKELVWQILEKFNLNKEKFDQLDDKDYLRVFKVILLLNFLSYFVDVSEIKFLNPNKETIKLVFQGEIEQNKIDEILEYIKEHNIVEQAPDGKFLVNISRVSEDELRNRMRQLEDKYKSIDIIFKNEPYKKLIKELEEEFSKSSFRKVELNFIDFSGLGRISNVVDNFKFDYSIKILLIFTRNPTHKNLAIEQVSEISKQERFKNVIFIIPEIEFDDETSKKFIKYKALSELETNQARKENYLKYSEDVLRDWLLNKLYRGIFNLYLNGNRKIYLLNSLNEKLNSEFSEKIFENGLERLKSLLSNQNNWKEKVSYKVIEEVLFVNDRDKLEEAFSKSQYKNLINIFKDHNKEYIVDENLNFKEGVSTEHPLKRLNDYVDKYIKEKSETGYFDLVNLIEDISKPPFGVFPCEVYSAALGFVFRKYINKLFLKDGTELSEREMRNILVEVFRKGKSIYVRLGSEYEKKLLELLSEIFNFNEFKNLRDLRWEVRKKLLPLWMIEKYFENKGVKSTIEVLREIYNRFLYLTDSEEIDTNTIRILVESIENATIDLKILIDTLFNSEEKIIEKYVQEYFKSRNLNYIDDSLKEKILEEIKKDFEDRTYEIQEKEFQEKLNQMLNEKVSQTLSEKLKELLHLEEDNNLHDHLNEKLLPIWLIRKYSIIDEKNKEIIEKFLEYYEFVKNGGEQTTDILTIGEFIEFLDKNREDFKESINLISNKKDEVISNYIKGLIEKIFKGKKFENIDEKLLLSRLYSEAKNFLSISVSEESFEARLNEVISKFVTTPVEAKPEIVINQIKEKLKNGDKDFELFLIQIFNEYPDLLYRIAKKLEEKNNERKGIFSFFKSK